MYRKVKALYCSSRGIKLSLYAYNRRKIKQLIQTLTNTLMYWMRSSEDQRPLFIYRAIEKKAGRSKTVVIGTDTKLHSNAIKQLTAVCNAATVSYWNVKFTEAGAVSLI